MCHQESKVHLSSEEAIAAEESLSVYCKPVELYNILQRRALRNVSPFTYGERSLRWAPQCCCTVWPVLSHAYIILATFYYKKFFVVHFPLGCSGIIV